MSTIQLFKGVYDGKESTGEHDMEIVRKEDIVFSSLRSNNLERILLSIATIFASFSPGQP